MSVKETSTMILEQEPVESASRKHVKDGVIDFTAGCLGN